MPGEFAHNSASYVARGSNLSDVTEFPSAAMAMAAPSTRCERARRKVREKKHSAFTAHLKPEAVNRAIAGCTDAFYSSRSSFLCSCKCKWKRMGRQRVFLRARVNKKRSR